ncbi:leucine-rich repeat neuronal protein 2, partial [Biomphalaria glabrata]
LSDNKLLALQHGTFNGLDSLRVLDLSRNGIRRVETHSFAGLTDLEVLNLKNNQLYQLERGWLLPLASLQRLYLSDNKISSLDDGVFAKLPELQHLDLSNNMIREVPDNAFGGLRSLNLLNFTGNSNMKEVPTKSLQPLPTVNILLLDGLAMLRLRSFAVGSIDVVELSMSYAPKLQVIEEAAFHNLSSLTSLQLHDNPRLVYIHPASFASVPRLRHLHLHNNGLVSVSSQLVTSLPSLYDLHLHHNRFFCDCNIYWLRKELSFENPRSSLTSPMTTSTDDVRYTLASTGTSSPRSLVSEPQRVSCYFQSGGPEMSLMQLPMEYFSPMCPPTVLAMFPADISLTIGEELWLECHGLGVPAPSLSWVLPGGREINATSNFVGETNFSLTEVLQDSALLHIKPVSLSDSGTYGCRAVNSISEEIKTTQVRVQNKPLSISDVRVGNDYITLAWRGAIPRAQMSDFQLFYKEIEPTPNRGGDDRDNSTEYTTIQLHGNIHKCTITGLKPLTTYEVCLVYRKIHPMQCSNYTTTQEVEVLVSDGIVRISKSQIGLGFAVVLGIVVLVVVLLLVRRARRRKDYQGPLADEEKASIPLEAVGPTVPSTPLTSSRTALLPNSQI